MRKLLAKYSSEEWVSFYNRYIQEHLMKGLAIQPCVHILDCTKVLVNLDNDNYENSSVVKIDEKTCADISSVSSEASWMTQG